MFRELHMGLCWNIVDQLALCEKEREKRGLSQSISGRGIDLCTRTDPS